MLLLSAAMAQAVITITIEEVDSDVVVTGSGTANLAGLNKDATLLSAGGLFGGFGAIYTGSSSFVNVDIYIIMGFGHGLIMMW